MLMECSPAAPNNGMMDAFPTETMAMTKRTKPADQRRIACNLLALITGS
jgi:hypothetical protein